MKKRKEMKLKKKMAKHFYILGLLYGQMIQLAKSIHKINKEFNEFGKWLKKIQEEKRKEIRKKIQKEEL